MKVKKLPNILAVHLKRFKFQEKLQKYIKLSYRVVFPMELRLFNTSDDADDADRLYVLSSVIVHIGNGPHHGHYVSVVKSGNTWVLFDDDGVEVVEESELQRYYGDHNSPGVAYILFYERAHRKMMKKKEQKKNKEAKKKTQGAGISKKEAKELFDELTKLDKQEKMGPLSKALNLRREAIEEKLSKMNESRKKQGLPTFSIPGRPESQQQQSQNLQQPLYPGGFYPYPGIPNPFEDDEDEDDEDEGAEDDEEDDNEEAGDTIDGEGLRQYAGL
ncbi:hypothetical protein HDU97_007907 [Phlyctochytrium planicorne]|nr:hypothetical protein HDU97_007907 [Phlyctochytrium planicorne]